MAKKGVKFSKAHRAKLSAAAKKRWIRKPTVASLKSAFTEFAAPNAKIGETIRVRLPNDYTVADKNVILKMKTEGLIDRMTQAIDKIEAQVKRLETL